MTELELDGMNGLAPQRRKLHTDWFLPILFRPKRTLEQISQQSEPVWAAPMLLLTVLILVTVLVAGPIRKSMAQTGVVMPESFQYMTPEQQAQLQEGLATRQGPIFVYVFPALGALFSLWAGWFLLGSILHLALTMVGSRNNNTSALNLAAWASVPLAFRFIVQSIYMLSTHQLISSPGLSGFTALGATGVAAFGGIMLGFIDLYFLWQVALLLVGVIPLSGLSKAKAWMTTLAVVVILLALQALPTFLMAQLQGMGTVQPFFFF